MSGQWSGSDTAFQMQVLLVLLLSMATTPWGRIPTLLKMGKLSLGKVG